MQAIRQIVVSLRSKVDDTAFALCLAAFAIALAGLAGAALISGPHSANKVAATASQQPVPRAFPGAYVDDAPVYRMPTINVSARRAVEMGRIEQEDLRALANGRAGSAG